MRATDKASLRPSYYRSLRKVGFLRWTWRIVDEAVSPHTVLAQGVARTEGRAYQRMEAAYSRLLDGTVA